jgi:hypothetical protein
MSAADDRAMARAWEEITRRTALGEFGQPPNLALRDRAMREMFARERSRLSHVIRYGHWVFSGSSAHAPHQQHPINEDLIARFKSEGDGVSWGIAESIERYEEETKKKVSRGADVAALYDQEAERESAKEVENRIDEALRAIDSGRVGTAAARGEVQTKMELLSSFFRSSRGQTGRHSPQPAFARPER